MNQPLATDTLVVTTDYAEGMAAARRAKTVLCAALFFVLGTELTLFFMLRYVHSLSGITAGHNVADAAGWNRDVFQYLIGLLDFAGLILPWVLAAMVLTMALIQTAGHVAGVGRTVSALSWSVLLAMLLFPWQAVLNNPAINADPKADAIGMKVPGVVYTWAEVSNPVQGARFAEFNASADKVKAALDWLRYAGFPLAALVIVGVVHTKTERAHRRAFGPRRRDRRGPGGRPGVVTTAREGQTDARGTWGGGRTAGGPGTVHPVGHLRRDRDGRRGGQVLHAGDDPRRPERGVRRPGPRVWQHQRQT